jgi:hypothetical protein
MGVEFSLKTKDWLSLLAQSIWTPARRSAMNELNEIL